MEGELQSGFEAYENYYSLPSNNDNQLNEMTYTFNDTMFSGVSLLSLLMSTDTQYDPVLTTSLLSNFTSPANTLLYNSPNIGFFSDEIPPCSNLPSFLTPKTHKPEPISSIIQLETTSDSYYDHSSQPLEFLPHYSPVFHQLPELLSLEQVAESSPFRSSLHDKRVRVDSSNHSRWLTVPRNVSSSSTFKPSTECSSSTRNPVMVPRGSKLARQRRQKVSEKTRCLQKLLPFDKKMDIATMLEEAYKYVKFLQAQLRALQTMPANSVFMAQGSFDGGSSYGNLGSVFSGLERLSRNQLLQVLVNSPVSQTKLCSQGCCVFSVEQLGLIKNLN